MEKRSKFLRLIVDEHVNNCFLAHSCAVLWPGRRIYGCLSRREGKKGEVLLRGIGRGDEGFDILGCLEGLRARIRTIDLI